MDPAPEPAPTEAVDVGEVALVVNPTAGKGRALAVADVAERRLTADGVRVRRVVGRDGDEALAMLRAAASEVDAVVAVGGDGLVSLALQVVAGTEMPLAVVPAGTGNDFAVALGTPPDPAAAAAVVAGGRTRRVDAVRTGDRWWGNVLSAGFDSAVNERANRMTWPKGRRRYDIATLAELRVLQPLPFVVEVDGERAELEAVLVAVGNGRSYGAGMQIAPGALLDDGLLDVTVIAPVSRLTLVRLFPTVFRGTHVRDPRVSTLRGRRVHLECDGAGTVAYADGERLGPLPVTAEVHPGALRVLG